jgi:hypothetical protein
MPKNAVERTLLISAATICFACPGYAATKTFLIGSFEELTVDGDITVIVDNEKAPSARATGDPAVLEALKFERSGLQMRVRIQDYEGKTNIVRVKQPLVVTIGGRGITGVIANGSASVRMNRLRTTGSATLRLSGPGSITIGQLESDRLNLSLVGAGDITISAGSARQGQFSVEGAGSVAARQLMLQRVKLGQRGNAKTHLLVSEQAEISNSGPGMITIDGNATCFVRQPGSARITCGKIGKQ